MDSLLFLTHYSILLLFGILLSAAFTGIQPGQRTLPALLVCFAFCGILQVICFILAGETFTRKIYPLIIHVPLMIFLHLYFHKRLTTALAAISTAYLFCQPAKWLGLLTDTFLEIPAIGQLVRILTFLIVGTISILFLAPSISALFTKETRNVLIFGMVPIIYYLFDYSTGIYTNLWTTNNQAVAEFLPFFLCIVFMIFCFIYYREYEQKADAERNEQVIRMMLEQQTKELDAIRRGEQEIRLLRHDMRLHLGNIAFSLENDDLDTAKQTLSGLTAQIDATIVRRYCDMPAINYILLAFADKCQKANIAFSASVQLTEPVFDEIIFASILSNALDNAYNAQMQLSENQRKVRLSLKHYDKKLLLSVKNPFLKAPVFCDGLPVSDRSGHGYGTQSIRYMTQRLGGDCQFMLDGNTFVLRVII